MKEPPDYIMSPKQDDYQIRLNNFISLLKWSFDNNDSYLYSRSLAGYLMVIHEQIKNL